jgi:hypothetical protein
MDWKARVRFQPVEDFLFSSVSRQALGHRQPPIHWVSGDLLPGIKRQEREDNHSPPSSAEVKNCGAIPPLPINLHNIVLN